MKTQSDPWLSSILNTRVFRLDKTKGEGEIGDLPTPYFAYAKTDTKDIETTKSLTDYGFFIADTNIIFEYVHDKNNTKNTPTISDIKIRPTKPSDENEVRRIASTAFTHTRFHADPFIDNKYANQIKAEWAGNFFKGKRGDALYVAEKNGKVIGFNQILIHENTAIIDLIAVDKDAQGHGAGKALIKDIQDKFDHIIVGTQLINQKSIALYEKTGFNVSNASYVLHYHAI